MIYADRIDDPTATAEVVGEGGAVWKKSEREMLGEAQQQICCFV